MRPLIFGLLLSALCLAACTSGNKPKAIDFPEGSQEAIDNALILNYLKEHETDWRHIQQTESGIYYVIDAAGEGELPSPAARLSVHYEGRLLNDVVFENSFERTVPVQIFLRNTLPGWQESLAMLAKGGEGRFIIPSGLARGPRATAKVPANSVVVYRFKVEDVKDTNKQEQLQ